MSDLAARWGQLIRQKRRAEGLSQTQLGELVGRPQSIISRWESGKQAPTVADHERLFAALPITSEDVAAVYSGKGAAA